MRRHLSFDCEGARLAATLDEAGGTVGLLIVSGGNETRAGAHRGMALLAANIAAAGHPVLRFDRRGIGDSEGDNSGFESSAPDIAAALAAFRAHCPAMTHIVAFGNCDAASALLLHQPLALDAMVLANPWVIELEGNGDTDTPALPPASAIRARYWAKIKDPASAMRLIRGEIDFGKLWRGVKGMKPKHAAAEPADLPARVGAAMAALPCPATVLLAKHDRTALVFAEAWASPAFANARMQSDVVMHTLDSASHSFTGNDALWLEAQLSAVLRRQ